MILFVKKYRVVMGLLAVAVALLVGVGSAALFATDPPTVATDPPTGADFLRIRGETVAQARLSGSEDIALHINGIRLALPRSWNTGPRWRPR